MDRFNSSVQYSANTSPDRSTPHAEAVKKDAELARPKQELASIVRQRTDENRASPPSRGLFRPLSAIKESNEEHDPTEYEADLPRSNLHFTFEQRAIAREVIARKMGIAREIASLIIEQCTNEQPCSVRALNILRCTAGGKDLFPAIPHPEIARCSDALLALENDERLACLTALVTEFERCGFSPSS